MGWEPEFIRFASDATILALWGAGLLLLAGLALVGERRRLRRRNIDAVGWVPWGRLSVAMTFAGFVLLAMAATGWLRA